MLHVVGAMNKGGTETMLMNVYRNINRDDITFDFVSFSEEEAYYNNEIRLLGGRVIKVKLDKNINKSTKVISDIIKKYGPYDVVHAHTLFNSGIAIMAAKKNNINVRISHAHTTFNIDNTLARNIYSKVMRFIINRNATKLLACSKEAGKFLFGEKNINSSKYTYLPNLVDYTKILVPKKSKVEKFKYDNNLEDSLVLGHIGTFKESKNQKFLIEITKDLVESKKNVKLILVGEGSMRKELEELVYQYNLNEYVIFTGIRDDIEVILHSMDIFVFPSIYEGLGLVLLEAQAAGLHCLVSNAIQPEADLNIGLVSRIDLSLGVKVWAEKILELSDYNKPSIEIIKQAFDDTGYSTENCINSLLKIYKMDEYKEVNV